MKPTVGRIVQYTLSPWDADAINSRRTDGAASASADKATGFVLHFGNSAEPGDIYPMVIVRVWSSGSVNGQVFLDGNDTLWVTSVTEGESERQWRWPGKVAA